MTTLTVLLLACAIALVAFSLGLIVASNRDDWLRDRPSPPESTRAVLERLLQQSDDIKK